MAVDVTLDADLATIPLSGSSCCYSAAAEATEAALSSAAMAAAIAAAATTAVSGWSYCCFAAADAETTASSNLLIKSAEDIMSFADHKHRCCRHQAQGNKSFYFPAFFMGENKYIFPYVQTQHKQPVSVYTVPAHKMVNQFVLSSAAPRLRLHLSKMIPCLFLLNLRKRQIFSFHAGFIYRIHFISIND